MKALVLSGGRGTRLRPLTNTITKQLLPVANRPILFYILDIVREAGIKSAGIVVSKEWGEQVAAAVGDGTSWGLETTFITQDAPKGIAHAVKIARKFLGDSPFLMVLGDNVYKCNIRQFVDASHQKKADANLLVKPVTDIHAFGIAELNNKGRVIRVQEKPEKATSNLALAGIYLFSSRIHEAIEQITPSSRGELEITDAIQKLIDMEGNVLTHILEGWWLDTGSKEDLLGANRAVMDEYMTARILSNIDSTSRIQGKVEIRDKTMIVDSVIEGPVSIAENCVISSAYIGPYSSIGTGVVIENTTIKDSIILANCYINTHESIEHSIIGQGTRLTEKSPNRGGVILKLGDNSSIEFK